MISITKIVNECLDEKLTNRDKARLVLQNEIDELHVQKYVLRELVNNLNQQIKEIEEEVERLYIEQKEVWNECD